MLRRSKRSEIEVSAPKEEEAYHVQLSCTVIYFYSTKTHTSTFL